MRTVITLSPDEIEEIVRNWAREHFSNVADVSVWAETNDGLDCAKLKCEIDCYKEEREDAKNNQ